MTRELIINGQHVDLPDSTDITLEFANNIVGDVGKINLSHSYTIKLPRTIRNARILDDPGTPAHESTATRQFLNARYYRNGIDLLGPVQLYILKTTQKEYELAMVWNTLEELQTLSQSDQTLNDLPGLPEPQWVESDGLPNYKTDYDGVVFAQYISGLGANTYPSVNCASHPSMRIRNLLERIMLNAKVDYELSPEAENRLKDIVLLAAPNHAPTYQMEIESGVRAYTVNNLRNVLSLGRIEKGWDAPRVDSSDNDKFYTDGQNTFNAMVNLHVDYNANMENAYVSIKGVPTSTSGNRHPPVEIFRRPFVPNETGWEVDFDEEINVSGWASFLFTGWLPALAPDPIAKDPMKPLVTIYKKHEALRLDKVNLFPIAGNLPDIKQWEFVQSIAAMFGLVLIIKNNALMITTYDEMLNRGRAQSWDDKIADDTKDPAEITYTLDNWTQANVIAFKDDVPLNFHPNISIKVEDVTLKESREWAKLAFAASIGGQAIHYNMKSGAAEDVKIQPRIFRLSKVDGTNSLEFTDDLYGSGMAQKYAGLQEAVRKPVKLFAKARLHELDIAALDLTRPVYLSQYGRYYMILKIQTSATDLCKVELLQLQ